MRKRKLSFLGGRKAENPLVKGCSLVLPRQLLPNVEIDGLRRFSAPLTSLGCINDSLMSHMSCLQMCHMTVGQLSLIVEHFVRHAVNCPLSLTIEDFDTSITSGHVVIRCNDRNCAYGKSNPGLFIPLTPDIRIETDKTRLDAWLTTFGAITRGPYITALCGMTGILFYKF